MHLRRAITWTLGLAVAFARPAFAGDATGATSATAPTVFLPHDGPRPIVVWLPTVIWSGAGGDVPRVVVYEDGELVFERKSPERSYGHRPLQRAELDELKRRVAAVACLAGLKRRYELSGAADGIEDLLFLRSGGREVVTDLYALAFTVDLRPGEVPAELLELRRLLVSLASSEGAEWTPRFVEVVLVPNRYASPRPQAWPTGWPGLSSDRAVKRGDGYSIFLDAPLEAELLRLLVKDRPTRPFELGGRRWSVGHTRPAFPGEPDWARAFDAAFR
jgi:hypothetical protein